ncbi:MAG: immunoglobulin domain-containing protein [Chloroflexi bacterium]|nr:immunoglobulin domain-containing protein [Chloroflexota bacterium]
MQKNILLISVTLLTVLATAATQAAVILPDDFSYPDGALQMVSTEKWVGHSGATNQVDVAVNALKLTDAESQDVNSLLAGQPYPAGGTDILFASFKVKFSALPGSAGGYFAHFRDAAIGFRARVWALSTGAAAGSFRLGVSSASSSLNAVLERDLNLNTDYTVVIRLVVNNAVTTLWVDPVSEADAGVSTDPGGAIDIATFAFRQAGGIGTMTIDDLVVGTSFADVVEPGAQAPQVLKHPQSQSVAAGSNVTLTVEASGTPPLTYQWQFEQADLSGQTGSSLTLNAVTTPQAGKYRVVVSNTAGSATSDEAILTVTSTAVLPNITTQLQSQSVMTGATVTFSVVATGTEPLFYQWTFNGADLPGKTSAALVLNGVTTNQAGNYQVFVSNAAGSVPSDIVTLTVQAPPPPVVNDIAFVRTLVDPANYLPTDTTTLYTVEGLVTTHINLTTTADALFYVQDDTGGIAVFVSGGAGVVPPAGAKVRVTAPLTHFNGLLEFRVTASNPLHSVTTLSTGHPLPEPTPFDYNWQFDPAVIEMQEGKYIVISNVFLDLTTPTFRTGGENVTITTEFGEPFILRVDARTDIGGQAKPTTAVTIFGVLGQFDSSNPRTSDYQIIPSRFADIVSIVKAPTVRFTNILENLIRPGDLPTNTFAEHALQPGETLTMRVEIADPAGLSVTLQAVTNGLPASAQWDLSALQGTALTGTFTFTPTAADAGVNYVVALEAMNSVATNHATWNIYVPNAIEQRIILSEFLANPATAGTAPHFNPLRRAEPPPNVSYEDEYVELANLSGTDLDLVGWTISDAVQVRHRFYESFSIQSSNAIVVYGGPLNGFVPLLDVPVIGASENAFGFGLNNTGGDSILIHNADGHLISRVVYSAVSATSSLTRYPNLNGPFLPHGEVTTNLVSPGKQFDGRPFSEPALAEPPTITLTAALGAGPSVLLTWKAEPGRPYSVLQSASLTGQFTPLAAGLSFANDQGQYEDKAVGTIPLRFYRVSSP